MKNLGTVYVLLGILGIPAAFIFQDALSHSYDSRTSWAAWVVGIGGFTLVVVGLVLLAVARELDYRDQRRAEYVASLRER
jgi:O-antigen/teichoic acid export membrane protein